MTLVTYLLYRSQEFHRIFCKDNAYNIRKCKQNYSNIQYFKYWNIFYSILNDPYKINLEKKDVACSTDSYINAFNHTKFIKWLLCWCWNSEMTNYNVYLQVASILVSKVCVEVDDYKWQPITSTWSFLKVD